MNITVAVCVLSMFILANCGLSQTTKRLRGEYDYTVSTQSFNTTTGNQPFAIINKSVLLTTDLL